MIQDDDKWVRAVQENKNNTYKQTLTQYMHSYEDKTIIYNKITKQFNANNNLVTITTEITLQSTPFTFYDFYHHYITIEN